MIMAGRNDPGCYIQPIEKFVKRLKEMKRAHEFIVEEKDVHMSGRVDLLKRNVTTGVNYLKNTLNVQ